MTSERDLAALDAAYWRDWYGRYKADADALPAEFRTYARTLEAAQSDNARIEYLTKRVIDLHNEVVQLRARIHVLERDGNGERG